MCLLGCGLLLPWNAVLTAFDYFQTLYDDKTFAFGVPISNQATNFIVLLVMIQYGTQWSFTKRIVAMFIVYDVLLVLLPPIGMLVGAGYKELSLILTYTCFCGFGCATAVLQSSLFGFAGLLPPEYTQAIMAGQGVSGVFMNVLMMICQAALSQTPGSGNDTETIEACMFFGLAAVVVLACIFSYGMMVRRRFIRYHIPDVDEESHLPVTMEQEEEYRRRYEEADSILQAPPSPVPGGASRPPMPPSPALEGAVPLFREGPRAQRSASHDRGLGDTGDELGHALLSPGGSGPYHTISHSEGTYSRSLSNTTGSTTESGGRSFGGGIPDSRAGIVRHHRSLTDRPIGMESPDDYSFTSLFDDKFVRAKKRGSQGRSREGSKTNSPKQSSPRKNPEIPELRFSGKEASALDLTQGEWAEGDGEDIEKALEVDACKVLRSVSYYGATVFSLFFVSLFLFPGFMTVACAKGPFADMGNSWYRLILITCFNTFDTVGRLVAPSLNAFIPKQCLWIMAMARLALVPLFYWFVYNDIEWWWGPLAFTCLLGLTNGLFGSVSMMRGPMEVEHHEREMAGTLMAFCLMMGIIGGSFAQMGAGILLKRDGIGNCHSAAHNATGQANSTLMFSHMQIAGTAMLRI